MLDTAVWAPNHRLTEPWRFFVPEKDTEARQQAAEAAYEYSLEGGHRGRAEAARQKVLEPPNLDYKEEVLPLSADQNWGLGGENAPWSTGSLTDVSGYMPTALALHLKSLCPAPRPDF